MIQISRRASKNAPDFSYGKNPAGNVEAEGKFQSELW
jgi:hypothetical protein